MHYMYMLVHFYPAFINGRNFVSTEDVSDYIVGQRGPLRLHYYSASACTTGTRLHLVYYVITSVRHLFCSSCMCYCPRGCIELRPSSSTIITTLWISVEIKLSLI